VLWREFDQRRQVVLPARLGLAIETEHQVDGHRIEASRETPAHRLARTVGAVTTSQPAQFLIVE